MTEKIKIAYCSDLHLDCYRYFNGYKYPDLSNKDKADILIIAGDLYEYINAAEHINFIKSVALEYNQVLIVEGNHEFYKINVQSNISNSVYPDNVIILKNNTFVYKDVMFYGGTLWCNLVDQPDHIKEVIVRSISDFSYVGYDDLAITIDNMALLYNDYIENLIEAQLDADKNNLKLVVVSHFAPSYKSVSPLYKTSAINPYFVNDLDSMIENSNIRYWISGHVHHEYDYMIGNTNLLCNPRGYNHETYGKKFEVKTFNL